LKENGSLFAGLFPLSAPPPELLSLATSMPDSEHYFSRLLGEQSEISRERLKELERSKQGSGHTCSLCGEAFPEIVALQVHIIKSHGAFPPESGIFGNPGSPGSLSPGEVERGSGGGGGNARRSTGEDGAPSAEGTPRRDQEEDPREENPRQSSSSTPRSSATGGAPDVGEREKPVSLSDQAKQFPHIEMLQRHMLSQQFPGLINPLLSGFPGFPPAPGSHLPFPNLHHLFGGKKPEEEEREEGERFYEGGQAKTFTSEKQKRRGVKRFKCSKCGLKFLKRELCLRHIHESHSTKRKLHFSPHKNLQQSSATKVRSNYVRQLMELLRVPTSRGTPQKSASEHIMQAFLLKTPKSNDENHNKDRNENSASGVGHSSDDNFVPSVVYLPVSRRVSEPMTVAFSLTPA
jgi:ribosomal protein L35